MNDIVSVVGGRLRTLGTERPTVDQIVADAQRANANGITLIGQGPLRTVTGVKVAAVVGPSGCSCCLGRRGHWCCHRSLYALADRPSNIVEFPRIDSPRPAA
jgi:hypothetical protein